MLRSSAAPHLHTPPRCTDQYLQGTLPDARRNATRFTFTWPLASGPRTCLDQVPRPHLHALLYCANQ